MTSFFTRKGDTGYSNLPGANHVTKADERFEAIGTLDELSSVLGLARSLSKNQETSDILIAIQKNLYSLMAELASGNADSEGKPLISETEVKRLEEKIEHLELKVEIPKKFIIPGDTTGGAVLDMARTIARRAERRVVSLALDRPVSGEVLKYLNRLSSLLFILELFENQKNGSEGPTLVK